MLGVFLFTLRPCSLSQGLSKSLELVPFGLGYAVVKSTCRAHPNFYMAARISTPNLRLIQQD